MAEELQHLIDRIQTEGVDKAEQEAAAIISKAKDKAAAVVAEAETEAKNRLKKADQDAEAFTERSIKTLEQAARDVLITVGQGVENILADVIGEDTGKALSIEVLQQMLVKIADAYASQEGADTKIEALVNKDDEKQLVDFFRQQYKGKLAGGVNLHSDNEVLKGFQVSFKDGSVYHDFSQEAIADALSAFLRPHLAEIVHRVASNGSKDAEGAKA